MEELTFATPIGVSAPKTGLAVAKICRERGHVQHTAERPVMKLASAVVAAALRVPRIRSVVMAAGRRKILNDAKKQGVPWEEDVAELQAAIPEQLEPLRKQIENSALTGPNDLPFYYLQPFHGYPDGNLGYLPALEAEVSSRTVHAKHQDNPSKDGDACLRGNARDILVSRWEVEKGQGVAPARILDIGCSVGLSTAYLVNAFPTASVVGVDPSSHMLAVGALRRPGVSYVHALGEQLPADYDSKFDIVSIQLVAHELPDSAFRAILREASRVLKKGGILCVMDVDPSTFDGVPLVIRGLFRSTEPFFEDHEARDIPKEIMNAGFTKLQDSMNTKSHRTHTAILP